MSIHLKNGLFSCFFSVPLTFQQPDPVFYYPSGDPTNQQGMHPGTFNSACVSHPMQCACPHYHREASLPQCYICDCGEMTNNGNRVLSNTSKQ